MDTNVGGKPLRKRRSQRPLIGYRLWRISVEPSGAALRAVNNTWLWEVENTAECLLIRNPFAPSPVPPKHDGPAPDIGCSCGLYAQLPEDPLESWVGTVRGKVRASGTILMWGRIIRCVRGFKAEHARVQSPVVIEMDCAGGGCGNDVTALKVGREMAAFCDEHRNPDTVEAAPVVRETIRQLESGYPSVEFLSYL